jgi:hypothetical protein
MDSNDLLDNAATESQNRSLLDSPETRGAVLRSISQWIRLSEHNIVKLLRDLSSHPDYEA